MRKEIYLAIIEQLKTIVDGAGIDKIKHYDLWNMNVEYIDQETAWDMPAVFIEFAPIQWKEAGNGCQQATVTIALHIATPYEGGAADGSIAQSDALGYFELLDDIHRALYGLKGIGFSALKRVSSQTNHNHEEIIESIETFTCIVIDK